MEKKKINKKAAIKFTIWTIICVVVVVGGSVWFGYRKSQTVWQDFLSRVGYEKPDANASSKIVFLGDSITFQEDWNVLFGVSDIANAGVSGNTTDDVLARLNMVTNAKPEKIFLMIGINDLLRGKDAPYVFANYQKIISEIRAKSPDTTIYMQSVLPVDNDVTSSVYGTVDSQAIVNLNNEIKSLSDENKIFFIDLYSSFCGADSKLYARYAKDGLHLNSHGYAVWEDLLAGYIK